MLKSQPPQPLALTLTRSAVQLLRPPAAMPFRPKPWTLRSCSQTLLEALPLMPIEAQLPEVDEEQLAAAVLWPLMQASLSVSSRLPTSTLLLPLRFSTLQVPPAPHSFGAVAPVPRMRVRAVVLGPLGILPIEQALLSPVAQEPPMPGAP